MTRNPAREMIGFLAASILLGAGAGEAGDKNAETARLEAQVAAAPEDLDLRDQLLGHYFLEYSPEDRAARARHALWVIDHHPEAELAGSPYASFIRHSEPKLYEQARDLWLAHVGRDGVDAAILGNAARFFVLDERDRSEELLKRAAALEPKNPEWKQRLAELYMLNAQRDGSDAAPARAALAQFETAIEQSETTYDRYLRMDGAAEAALQSGDESKARQYATDLLRLAGELPRDWNYGNAIHDGHRILGLLALRANDLEGAKSHLLQAGATPGSPQLDSFGPELDLADALLGRGERATVVEYLRLCRRFWKMRQDALDAWIEQIQAGKTPTLERFGAMRS